MEAVVPTALPAALTMNVPELLNVAVPTPAPPMNCDTPIASAKAPATDPVALATAVALKWAAVDKRHAGG